jgi:hypothetical protein
VDRLDDHGVDRRKVATQHVIVTVALALVQLDDAVGAFARAVGEGVVGACLCKRSRAQHKARYPSAGCVDGLSVIDPHKRP